MDTEDGKAIIGRLMTKTDAIISAAQSAQGYQSARLEFENENATHQEAERLKQINQEQVQYLQEKS